MHEIFRHHSPTHVVATHCNHAWRMAGDLEEKVRVVAEVTPRKSAGFGTNAEEPLQPRGPHPGRGLGNAPGVVIERSAHAKHYPRLQAANVVRHPAFLFRGAQPDEYDVRLRSIDLAHDRRVLIGRQLTEGRSDRAGDSQTRIALRQDVDEPRVCSPRAPVEKDTPPPPSGALRECEHES